MKDRVKRVIYNGVVITRQENGKFRWYKKDLTLKECKQEIDEYYKGKSPLGNVFSMDNRNDNQLQKPNTSIS